jgi:hypothetical protein
MPSQRKSSIFPALKESDIQIQVADWLRLYESARDFIFMSIPNEGKDRGNVARLMKLLRMGLRPGASDTILFQRGRAYCLEVKTEDGVQSDDQKAFEADCARVGVPYAIARSFEEAQEIVRKWKIVA